MADQTRKLSDIMKEMAETLLRNPRAEPSSEAAHVALMFANVAWNECVGMEHAREGYRSAWENIEAHNPALWNELESNDIDAMIDGLVHYKEAHYPDDRRRILVCGMVESGNVHVEWLEPAAPGVDSKWEMRIYGLIRAGRTSEAITFLRETRRLTHKQAAEIAALFASKLKMK